MWMLFLENIRLLVAAFQTQSGHFAGLDPAGSNMAQLELSWPMYPPRPCVDVTASIMQCPTAHHCFTPAFGLLQDANCNLSDRQLLSVAAGTLNLATGQENPHLPLYESIR